MFAEEEWTDALPVVKHVHAVKTGQLGGKHKTISKQCLKRTLQTLGSVPDWERIKPSEGSDREEDQALAPHPKKKRKKCKKRKKSSDPKAAEEAVQETPAKKRHVKPKREKRIAAEKREKPEKARGPEGDKLTRQQWKNKMKNKRRSKNKFLNDSAGQTNDKLKEETSGPAIDDLSLQRKISKETRKTSKETRKTSKETRKMSKETRKTSKETRKPTSENVADRKRNGANPSVPVFKEPEPNRCEKQKPARLDKAKRLRQILNSHASECRKESPEGDEDVKTESNEERNPLDRSSALRSRMVQRLESARFRYINELLYTSTSGEAKRMFRQDPDAVGIYHKGYSAQVKHWPANPVDLIISFIQKKPSSLVVADFGCGDCKVARSVKNKVHCFDLAPVCDLVTVCDMANVPLADSSVDIAVFCLSLMGTNLTEFLAEANRVLVMGGVLKIAEVASRFDNIRQFTGALSCLGFKLVSKDTENSHFYSFEFVKTDNVPDNLKKIGLQLKPCLYKKR